MSQELTAGEGAASVGAAEPRERRVGSRTPIILTVLAAGALLLPNKVAPGNFFALMFSFYGPLLFTLLFVIWWLFFSKATWKERLTDFGAAVLLAVVTAFIAHPSMGFALLMYMPVLMLLGWSIGLAIFQNRPDLRKVAVPLLLLPAVVVCSVLRFDGITGEFDAEFNVRWAPTAEQKYLAARSEAKKPAAPDSAPTLRLTAGDWPAFRGPNRDGVLKGVKIRTDWNQNPPKQLWRHLIGPGWSSVAVVGKHVFTQEQRGSEEVVVCLNLEDGKEVWSHVDESRFEEPVAGPGPRATPTFADGRLFTFGARGILNAFDAATGKLLWSHDLAAKYKKELQEELGGMDVPMWGFSASPLVAGDKVAVYLGAKDKGVAVFNVADGKNLWIGGHGGHSYTSIHHAKVADADVLLSVSNKGTQALDPATGKQLWNHEWILGEIVPCVQPALLDGDRVAVGVSFGKGTRVFHVAKSGDGFTTNEVATHTAFKPYYSDFVLIGDTAYGFDGAIFGCFDLKTGKRVWKGGRYGSGQVLLLADQNLLLVVSEMDGNVVLIPADRSGHKEIAKFKALKGKTWNHPVVAHGKLIVRNGEEIACFDVAEK